MFYGWIVVGASCLISLYVSGSINLGFTAAIEPIANELGWSYAQVSLAASLRGLEVGLLVPIAGALMDRWGLGRLIFGGAVLSGLGMMLLSRIHSLPMFYASFILVATGASAATSILLMATVANWFRRNEGLAMGVAASGVALGGLLIPLVTGLIDQFGWRQAMVIMGLGMWAVPLPLSLLLRHKPEQYGCLPEGEEQGSKAIDEHAVPENNKRVQVKGVLTSRTFWIMSTGFFCHMLTVSATTTHIMPYLSSIGMGRTRSSLIASALPLMTIVGRVGLGWTGDRVDKRRVAALCIALASFGTLILGCATSGQLWILSVSLMVSMADTMGSILAGTSWAVMQGEVVAMASVWCHAFTTVLTSSSVAARRFRSVAS